MIKVSNVQNSWIENKIIDRKTKSLLHLLIIIELNQSYVATDSTTCGIFKDHYFIVAFFQQSFALFYINNVKCNSSFSRTLVAVYNVLLDVIEKENKNADQNKKLETCFKAWLKWKAWVTQREHADDHQIVQIL